jgi:AraC-like DNA-binding protein
VDPRIGITLRIIEEGKGSLQLDLSETSRMLGVSEAHLRRLFQREVGKTFQCYLRDARMTRATELLREYTRSIKQISVECGYSDVSNFYRDFRLVYGITPRRLRFKQWAALPSPQANGANQHIPQSIDLHKLGQFRTQSPPQPPKTT